MIIMIIIFRNGEQKEKGNNQTLHIPGIRFWSASLVEGVCLANHQSLYTFGFDGRVCLVVLFLKS